MADKLSEATNAMPEKGRKPRVSGVTLTGVALLAGSCLLATVTDSGVAYLVSLGAGVLLLFAFIDAGLPRDRKIVWTNVAVSGVSLVLLAAWFLYPVIAVHKESHDRTLCAGRLYMIGMALSAYASDGDQGFPPDLSKLRPRYIDNALALECPAKRTRSDFIYVAGLRNNNDPATCVLAFDRTGNHKGGGNVMFVGPRLQWMPEAELQKSLAETREYARKQGREIKLVGE